jgi:PAS domain S-box-containing protein
VPNRSVPSTPKARYAARMTHELRFRPPDQPEDLFRSLVEQLPVVVFLLSDEDPARTLYVNDQIQEMLGYPVEDWLDDGEHWLRILHPDERDALVRDWNAARNARHDWDGEFRYRHVEGHYVWIHERTRPVLDADGEVSFWEGILEDVTDRMNAQRDAAQTHHDLIESEARFRSLIENLPAVVYIESNEPQPRTIFVSQNVNSMLGHPSEGFVEKGDLWMELIHPDDRERVLDTDATAIQRGGTFDIEYRFIRPDGEEIWVHDHCVLARDVDGNPIQWQGVLVDITARVRAERELAASAARYQALVEGIPAVVYEMGLDDHRRTLYASPHIEALFGYTREEWLDQQDIWTELLHPDDREIELAAHDLHSSTGEAWAREYRLIAADGRVVWVRDHAMLLRDVNGKPLAWQGVMVDVTAQKEAEGRLRLSNDELEFRVMARTSQLEEANELMSLEIGERRRVEQEHRAAEERFRHLVEDLPAVVYRRQTAIADDDRDHSYASPQIDELLGFTPAEWCDDRFRTSRVHPHDRDAYVDAWARSSITGEPFQMEYRCFQKDGRIVSVFDRATMLSRNSAGDPFVFQGVLIDLTARLAAERKAAEAEERFRELAELTSMVPYSFELTVGEDAGVERHSTTPVLSELLGLPREAWNEQARWLELVHPDDRDRLIEQTRRITELGEPWDLDYRMIASGGRIVWLSDRGRCIGRDEHGRPVRFQGVVLDVTARRLAQDATADELAILREVVHGMPAIPWTHTLDAATGWVRYPFMGKQCFELTGYTAEELMAEPYHVQRLVHPDDLERMTRRSDESDRTGVWEDEYRVVHRDGSIRWIHGLGRRVTPPEVWPATWQGVTIDVTSRHPPEARIDEDGVRDPVEH